MFQPSENFDSADSCLATIGQFLSRTDNTKPAIDEKNMELLVGIQDKFRHLSAFVRSNADNALNFFEEFHNLVTKTGVSGPTPVLVRVREQYLAIVLTNALHKLRSHLQAAQNAQTAQVAH